MFEGSYIQVILDIAETDPHCKLSFVKSDIENARKELAELQSRPTPRAGDVCHVCGAKLPALTQICVVCGTRA